MRRRFSVPVLNRRVQIDTLRYVLLESNRPATIVGEAMRNVAQELLVGSGSVGIGLVWGWLVGRHMLWLGCPKRTFLAVAATSVLVAAEVKLFADWLAVALRAESDHTTSGCGEGIAELTRHRSGRGLIAVACSGAVWHNGAGNQRRLAPCQIVWLSRQVTESIGSRECVSTVKRLQPWQPPIFISKVDNPVGVAGFGPISVLPLCDPSKPRFR